MGRKSAAKRRQRNRQAANRVAENHQGANRQAENHQTTNRQAENHQTANPQNDNRQAQQNQEREKVLIFDRGFLKYVTQSEYNEILLERDDEDEVRKFIIDFEVQQQYEALTWREKRLEWVHKPAFKNTMQRLEEPVEETVGGLVLGDNGDLQWDEAMPADVWKINKDIILLKGLEEARLSVEAKTCPAEDDDEVIPPEPFQYTSSESQANDIEAGQDKGNDIVKLPLELTQASTSVDLANFSKPVDCMVNVPEEPSQCPTAGKRRGLLSLIRKKLSKKPKENNRSGENKAGETVAKKSSFLRSLLCWKKQNTRE